MNSHITSCPGYFVAPDADGDTTVWRDNPDHPSAPQPVITRRTLGDDVLWTKLTADLEVQEVTT